MSTPKVAICCPHGDHVAALWAHDFARCLAHTIRQRPQIEMMNLMMPGSLIVKQRETLALEVLKTDYTHILWLDTDMRFPPDTLLQLLDRGKRIVAANYVERRPPYRPVAFPHLERASTRLFSEPGDTDCEPVEAVGFGCILVETDVFRRVPEPWFAVGWVAQTQEYVGEDVYWCAKMREHGETIWLDHALSQQIAHIGSMEFNMQNAIQYHQMYPSGNGHDGPAPVVERVLSLAKP